jgi:hypothetical protein
MPVQGARAGGPPPPRPGWLPGRAPGGGRSAASGVVALLGARRELVAWLLTAAAAALVIGRAFALFAYPVLDGLRLNAVTVGPGLAAVDLVGVTVAAALLAVAAESTPKSRLIVLIDLLLLVLTGTLALIGLGLTLAAYGVAGIAGLVSGAVLVQVGNLVVLVVAALVVRRALARTPRPSSRPDRPRDGLAPAAGTVPPGPLYGQRPPYGPGAPSGPASQYGPRSPYGQGSPPQRPMPDRQAPSDGSGRPGR